MRDQWKLNCIGLLALGVGAVAIDQYMVAVFFGWLGWCAWILRKEEF